LWTIYNPEKISGMTLDAQTSVLWGVWGGGGGSGKAQQDPKPKMSPSEKKFKIRKKYLETP